MVILSLFFCLFVVSVSLLSSTNQTILFQSVFVLSPFWQRDSTAFAVVGA